MSDKQITPLQYQSIFEYLHDQFGIAANNSDIDDLIEYVSRVQAASLSTGMPSLDKPILTDEDVKAWEKAEAAAVKGAVWVKASDRLPEPFKVVVCKYTPDSPDPRKDTELHWGYVIKGGLWAHYGWRNDQVEWLDELFGITEQLNESPTAAGDGKEDAVAFGDWIGEQNYKSFRTTKHSPVEWFKGGRSDRKAGTTAQLYEIFKNRNK